MACSAIAPLQGFAIVYKLRGGVRLDKGQGQMGPENPISNCTLQAEILFDSVIYIYLH